MSGDWRDRFVAMWRDSWFFRLNVVLASVGLLRLFLF